MPWPGIEPRPPWWESDQPSESRYDPLYRQKIVYITHRDSAPHRERSALSLVRHFGGSCETKQSLCGIYRYTTWTICTVLTDKPGGSFSNHCAERWLSTTPLEVWETGGTAAASRSGRFTFEERDPGTKG